MKVWRFNIDYYNVGQKGLEALGGTAESDTIFILPGDKINLFSNSKKSYCKIIQKSADYYSH
jgi:hypothetical protein